MDECFSYNSHLHFQIILHMMSLQPLQISILYLMAYEFRAPQGLIIKVNKVCGLLQPISFEVNNRVHTVIYYIFHLIDKISIL